MSGCFTFLTYASSIFASTNVGISPNSSAVLLAVAQLTGNLLTTKLADKLGRKILIIVSLAGSALFLITTAAYFYLESSGYDLSFVRWTPVISLSLSIFIVSVGLIPLTTICTVEVLPQKVKMSHYLHVQVCSKQFLLNFQIRTFGMTLTTITINVFAFIVTKYFPILSEVIQMHGCFTIMAFISLLGIFFVHLAMDETKGQNLDYIGNKQSLKASTAHHVDVYVTKLLRIRINASCTADRPNEQSYNVCLPLGASSLSSESNVK